MSTTEEFWGLPITQVSVTVPDLEVSMRAYHELFGWGPWKVYLHEPPLLSNRQLFGQPADFTFLAAETHIPPAGMNFELTQPLEGRSLWSDFLEQTGGGVQSIAVMMRSFEESAQMRKKFEDAGMEVVLFANIGPQVEFYYVNSYPRLKVWVETGSGHVGDGLLEPMRIWPDPADAK